MLLPKLPLLRHAIFAIRCPDLAAGGVRPSAVRTTAQPYTAGRPTRRGRLCFKDSAPGGREESPPRSCPQRVSGARQQIINLCQLANQPVRPSMAFPGVRLIRAHAVTDCPVGFEIHWYQMQSFCGGGWPPGGTAGTKLGPSGPANGPGMASAPSRRDY